MKSEVMADQTAVKQALLDLKETPERERLRKVFAVVTRVVPKTVESLEIFSLCFGVISEVHDEHDRREFILEFSRTVPRIDAFLPLYKDVCEAAVTAADSISDDHAKRITELTRLASEMPRTNAFAGLRVRAWRLAMGLSDKPRFAAPDLKRVAKELPKANDYMFYRRYTLLGLANELPREAIFRDAYREAFAIAIDASAYIDEPYYRKYALVEISNRIKDSPDLFQLYKKSIEEAYKAVLDLKDPFARVFGLHELLTVIPRAEPFFPLLQDVMAKGLSFFTMKSWMDDIEVFDVVDFVLSADEGGMHESKQKRFVREKYANLFSRELEGMADDLNDMRFIHTLKPFTHVWVHPRTLRESVKKVVSRLESLKDTYHGDEMERPVFIREVFIGAEAGTPSEKAMPRDCIAIDLGATNTVLMRKRAGARPEFISPGAITRRYGNIVCVPTVLGLETGTIGAEVVEERPVVNIKQLLLDGNPKGRDYMEKFFKILSQRLRGSAEAAGWFPRVFRKGIAGVLYITVPVGFIDYKNSIREIAENTFKGMKVEFIEEPMAAAIGYEVAGLDDKVIMVIDFGGSTFNTMILRLSLSGLHVVAKPERALFLGGSDIDLWLAEYLAGRLGMSSGAAPPYPLTVKAEEMKIALSNADEVDFEWNGQSVCKVSRYEFEEILDRHDFYRYIDRSVSGIIKKAEKVGLKRDRIEAVLLTGGSSQIPSFKDKIGHIFPALRGKNLIYDHSPLSAVSTGAALFGSCDVVDRHLAMAYAIRYATTGKESPFSYSILLEKGDPLPFEKTFRVRPARKLGEQRALRIELFEVPDGLISRRWVREEGVEFLKQELSEARQTGLNGLKTINVGLDDPSKEDVALTFSIAEDGRLSVKWGADNVIETGIRLQ